MSSPARILHVRNCRGIATITGPERRLLSLFSGIDASAFDLHLLCLFNPSEPSPAFDSALWRRTVGERHHRHEVQMTHRLSAGDLMALRSIVKRAGIQIIATHDARSAVVGLTAARALGLPSIAFAHGWVNWTRTWSKRRLYAALEALAIRLADRIVVASRAMEADLLSRGIDPTKIRHIPHGLDLDSFSPGNGDAMRARLGVPKGALLVGTVGRLQPVKGHRYFLEAAAAVARRHPAARFLIVGDITCNADRAYRDEIVQLASTLGIQHRCHFTGTVTDMADVMRALDVFVLSSTAEPFGWVLIEAQACGTPVVSTRVGGTPEAVREGSGGMLVPPADSAALAASIVQLLDDPQQRQSMGSAGRTWVEENYGLPRMIAASEALYRELLPGRVENMRERRAEARA